MTPGDGARRGETAGDSSRWTRLGVVSLTRPSCALIGLARRSTDSGWSVAMLSPICLYLDSTDILSLGLGGGDIRCRLGEDAFDLRVC